MNVEPRSRISVEVAIGVGVVWGLEVVMNESRVLSEVDVEGLGWVSDDMIE